MAHSHIERYSLIAVFAVALLALVGLVALVSQGPALPTGIGLAAADSNLAGNAVIGSRQQSTLFHYREYDAVERVIEFREIRSNMWFIVPLDARGRGTIVYQGLEYSVLADLRAATDVAATGPNIKVDTNRDGVFDTKVALGKTFLIYY